MYASNTSTYEQYAAMNIESIDLMDLAAMHQAVVPQTIGTGSSAATALTPSSDAEVVRRPWLDPPDGFLPYDYQNGINLPAVGAGDTTVLSFPVPIGYDGVINDIANNVNFGGFTDFSGDIIWRILADGKPIRGFENIQNQKGTIQQPRKISPIRIFSGQTITYVVNHEANIALTGQVICSFTGYLYPNQGN